MERSAGLPRLLTAHAAVTLAAAVVLVVAPGVIPHAVGITLDPSAYLLSYLLAGAEAGFALLCYLARRLEDRRALRAIVSACVLFHAFSALLEIYAFTRGLDAAIWGNVVARGVIIGLFIYYAPSRREG